MIKLSFVTAVLAAGIGCRASPAPATKNDIFVKGQGHFILSPVLKADNIASRQESGNRPPHPAGSLYLTNVGDLTASWDQAARYLMITTKDGNTQVVLADDERDAISISAAKFGDQSLQAFASQPLRRESEASRHSDCMTGNNQSSGGLLTCLDTCQKAEYDHSQQFPTDCHSCLDNSEDSDADAEDDSVADTECMDEDLGQCVAACGEDESSIVCSECNGKFVITSGFEMEIIYATASIADASVSSGIFNKTEARGFNLREIDDSCSDSNKRNGDGDQMQCTKLLIHDPLSAPLRRSSSKLMLSRDEFQVPGGMNVCPCPVNQAYCMCDRAYAHAVIQKRDSPAEAGQGKFAFFSLVWRPQRLDNGMELDDYQVNFCVADVLEADKPVYAVMTKNITSEIKCAEIELQVIFDPVYAISEVEGQ